MGHPEWLSGKRRLNGKRRLSGDEISLGEEKHEMGSDIEEYDEALIPLKKRSTLESPFTTDEVRALSFFYQGLFYIQICNGRGKSI